MITPIMIGSIGWGTYLFFAVVNACFLPVIYFLYPETARRSLEEIDLIFAKGYLEKTSYVRAARELPFLSDEEIERMAVEYGFVEGDAETVGGGSVGGGRKAGVRMVEEGVSEGEVGRGLKFE